MIIRYKALSPSKPSKLNLVLTSKVHGEKDDSGILKMKNNILFFLFFSG